MIICNSSENKNSKEEKSPTIKELSVGFKNPTKEYHPETWFHLNGNNISKEGLKLDLQAVKDASIQGIHLFNKAGRSYPNVKPIKILSPEWEDMIR
ncbi:MAG: glycosyl hydrolase, partial [Flavobacteriaceae bacterium]